MMTYADLSFINTFFRHYKPRLHQFCIFSDTGNDIGMIFFESDFFIFRRRARRHYRLETSFCLRGFDVCPDNEDDAGVCHPETKAVSCRRPLELSGYMFCI
ncbi:MAG: hypothetical protein LUE21_05405, partial [Oscillospiraceae bacterium]|nr:hypothetical protein [Oscillospiraceae bacterium]